MQILATLLLLFISVANAFHKLSSRISQIAFGKADEAVDQKQADVVARSSSSVVIPARSSNSKRLKLLGVAQEIDGLTGAFIGGTVGVMSMAIMVELRVKKDEEQLASCPYCMGNGEILCASCFGNCTSTTASANGVTCYCDVCAGRGLIQCVNCKGDGRETPIIFKSKAVRDPEYAADGISIDSPSII